MIRKSINEIAVIARVRERAELEIGEKAHKIKVSSFKFSVFSGENKEENAKVGLNRCTPDSGGMSRVGLLLKMSGWPFKHLDDEIPKRRTTAAVQNRRRKVLRASRMVRRLDCVTFLRLVLRTHPRSEEKDRRPPTSERRGRLESRRNRQTGMFALPSETAQPHSEFCSALLTSAHFYPHFWKIFCGRRVCHGFEMGARDCAKTSQVAQFWEG